MVTRSDGDHHVRYDTVCRTYGKLRKKHSELPNKSLKFLRKTGSTKLRGEIKYMLLDQLYLGTATRPSPIDITMRLMASRIPTPRRGNNLAR